MVKLETPRFNPPPLEFNPVACVTADFWPVRYLYISRVYITLKKFQLFQWKNVIFYVFLEIENYNENTQILYRDVHNNVS